MNLYNDNSNIDKNQNIYDIYNEFIKSNDRDIFFKMVQRINIFNEVKHLSGDIIECGVFKGMGIILWLKLLNMYSPHSIKKVIGFDFFDKSFVDNLDNETDRILMKQVFDRCKNLNNQDISMETIKQTIYNSGFNNNQFDLVKGDISLTSYEYIKNKPGLRISLLYLDLDLEKPTYDTLVALWDKIVPGGIVVFDEYAYHNWSESNAVDKFFSDKNIKFINTNIKSPTLYLKK